MKIATALAVACLFVVGLAAGGDARAVMREYELNIPKQSLDMALRDFAQQTGLQIALFSDTIDGNAVVGPVLGTQSAEDALKTLLAPSGLSYKVVTEGTIAVLNPKDAPVSAPAVEEKEKSFWGRFRISQADTSGNTQSTTNNSSSASSSEEDRKVKIGEIVVTATKREERLQDVPMSIEVVTADDIDRRGLKGAEDYLRGIPGVNLVNSSTGQTIVIRGVETSPFTQNFFGSATVASYFGETPTTSSQGASSESNIDLKLADIERVEVLRGPQGTAFGSSALGGLVRTIPVSPKLDRFEGKIIGDYSVTSGSGGNNYNLQAVGNFPLITDRLALRLVAYQYEQSGYYTNVAGSNPAFLAEATRWGAQGYAVDQDEVGKSTHTGGRLAALFQATDDLKLTLSFLNQKGEVDGNGVANADTGIYGQGMLQVLPEQVVRGKTQGVFDTEIEIWNLVADYDLHWASLLGTYSNTNSDAMNVVSVGAIPTFPLPAKWPATQNADFAEVRLATKLDGAWNFLGGVYYENLDDAAFFYPGWQGSPERNPFQPGTTGIMGNYTTFRELEQKAAFGEVSWAFLPRWTLSGGVRYYDYTRQETSSSRGPVYGDVAPALIEGNADGTSYRGNLSFKPDDHSLLYASWSQGFRLGRAQNGLNNACDPDGDGVADGTNVTIASTKLVESDSLDSYEIGTKLTLFADRLTIAADYYYIDWTNLPFLANIHALGSTTGPENGCYGLYTANFGKARSKGTELQVTYNVTNAFRVDFGGSTIDSRLAEDVPVLSIPAGTKLPAFPEINLNVGVQYEFNIAGRGAFVRADSIYVGDFKTGLGDLERASGGYTKVDLTARVAFKNLSVDVYARNITNSDEFTFAGYSTNGGSYSGFRLRPRTLGLQLSYNFGGP